MPSRLQRVAADTEFSGEFKSFDELCQAVSETSWSKSFDLNAAMIASLIAKHKTITHVEQPDPIVTDSSSESVDEIADESVKIVKTFDEGGKGKKPCPQCNKYVGLRTAVCACGYKFVSKPVEEVVKVVKTSESGGKGKKQCSNCQKFSGVRTTICACGTSFVSKVQAKLDSRKDEEEQHVDIPETVTIEDVKPVRRHVSGYKLRILAPAGNCPHRLDITSNATIEQWAERCRKTFMDRDGSWLTINALRFFVREFHNSFVSGSSGENPEYRRVCDVIESFDTRL